VNPLVVSVPAAVIATGGVAAYGAVHPRAQLFGPTICRTNSPRKLAITFDDGPNPAITPRLLDLLDRHQAKSTFFVIGGFVRQCPELVRETTARGHVIGNHTGTHPNLFWLAPSQIDAELRACQEAISETLGAAPQWFRPPYGFRNPWVIPAAAALGCQTAMWTLIPGDWREKPAEWLIARMGPIAARAQRAMMLQAPANNENARVKKTDPSASARGRPPGDRGADGVRGAGDILCLHDGYHRQQNYDRTRTLTALEHWLPRWRDLGLEFVTMEEAVRPLD
jgi:peptidoglycan-N-acetylglucosamine deacetylase